MKTNTLTNCLHRYLETLERINQEKQTLKAIEEEATQVPGVEKRPFRSIARALYDSPGEILAKLNNMEEFIATTFSAKDSAKLQL